MIGGAVQVRGGRRGAVPPGEPSRCHPPKEARMTSQVLHRRGTMQKSVVLALVLVFIAGFVALTGCSVAPSLTAVASASGAPTSSTLSNTSRAGAPNCSAGGRHPLLIGISQDKSGSANSTPTPQLAASDFLPLYAALRCSGGEIGFMVILADSKHNLIRLRIEVPPTAPMEPIQNSNPLIAAEEMAAHQPVLAQYKQQYDDWAQETEERIQHFERAAKPLLDAEADSPRTDFNTTVNRLDLFQTEPRPGWDNSTIRRVSLLVSDACDNAHKEKPKAASGARLLLVFGGPIPAPVQALNPIQFEAIAPAIRYITRHEEGD
jgi:hypothetical protein